MHFLFYNMDPKNITFYYMPRPLVAWVRYFLHSSIKITRNIQSKDVKLDVIAKIL